MTAHTTREPKQTYSRTPFRKEEDEKIKMLVEMYGTDCWRNISMAIGRTAKQCRDRYFNCLAPNLKNGEWTAAEEHLLEEKVHELGTKWSAISKFFTCRSPNNIKNHWNRVMLKKIEHRNTEIHVSSSPEIEMTDMLYDFTIDVDNNWSGALLGF